MTDNDNLIKLLGIAALPIERKAGILDKAATMVQQRILLRLYKTLDDAGRDKLNALVEANDEDGVSQFMDDNAPDMLKWIEEESQAVKDELKKIADRTPLEL